MATALSAQLEALAGARDRAPKQPIGTRPSLIFDPVQAANVDLQTIYSLAVSGLEELARIDGQFDAYRKTLFSPQSSQTDRELQTKQFNEKLDQSLNQFLRLLSPYIMLTPAHQTFEYLIRLYKVQQYNVEEVMACILPYHETALFVQIVKLLHIQGTIWEFLQGVQTTGAPPPRALLVQRCSHSLPLLGAICDSAMVVSGSPKGSKIVTLSTVLITETIAAVPTVTTELVNKILPYILHSFGARVHEEFQVGALMIIGALANKCSLAPALLVTIFDSVSKQLPRHQETNSPLVQLSIRILVILAQTQQIEEFPVKAFKFFVKVRELPIALSELGQKYETRRFMSLFLKSLAEYCTVHEHYEQVLLQVIEVVQIGSLVVQLVPWLVLHQHVRSGSEDDGNAAIVQSKAITVIRRLLRAIELQFPREMDTAINLIVKENKGRTEVKNLQLVQEVLQGSLYRPLTETHTSLLQSLDHSEAKARRAAVESLAELVSKCLHDEQMFPFVRDAVKRRMYDEDFSVMRALLKIGGLVKIVPPRDLFEALSSLLIRCSESLHGEAKVVARVAIQLLAGEFVEENPGYTEQIGFVLLQYILVLPKTWKFNWAVFKVCQHHPFPLFNNLGSIPDVPPEAQVPEGQVGGVSAQTRKQNLRGWVSSINSKMIRTMSASLTNDNALLPTLARATKDFKPARAVVMLVLLDSLLSNSSEVHISASDYFTLLSREWDSVQSDENFASPHLSMINYESWEVGALGACELYERLESKPNVVYVELVLCCLHKLVDHAFGQSKDVMKEVPKVVEDLFVLFAMSSVEDIFEPHMALLCTLLASRAISFLVRFLQQQVAGSAVPVKVQMRALDLVLSHLECISGSSTDNLDLAQSPRKVKYTDVQSLMASLLVVLASPSKAVRKKGLACLKLLRTLVKDGRNLVLDEQGPSTAGPVLPLGLFAEFAEALAQQKKLFLVNESHLTTFFAHTLGASSKLSPKDPGSALQDRFDDEARRSIVLFLASQALLLSGHPQRVLLSSLLRAEHDVELASATWELLSGLLSKRRLSHLDNSCSTQEKRLSDDDVQLLCLLLQAYTPTVAACAVSSSSKKVSMPTLSGVFEALVIEGGSVADPAVEQPCLAAIRCLSPPFYEVLDMPSQDRAFQSLISSSSSEGGAIRAAAREAVRHLPVPAHVFAKHVSCLTGTQLSKLKGKKMKIRKGDTGQQMVAGKGQWPQEERIVQDASALLELLLGLQLGSERYLLLKPLFELLQELVSGNWPSRDGDSRQQQADLAATEGSDSALSTVSYVYQLTLMILESIIRSMSDGDQHNEEGEILAGSDIDLIVRCVSTTTSGATRNQALALLTAAGNLFPQKILSQVINIVSVIGTSVVTQDVGQSHEVVFQMLATVVPGWLESTQTPEELFKVFVDALPQVPAHRQLALITNLLRVTTENVGLHIFLWLLVQSFTNTCIDKAPENGDLVEDDLGGWQLEFAAELCEQYPSAIQLPAFVKLLAKSRGTDTASNSKEITSQAKAREFWSMQRLIIRFVTRQLRASEMLTPNKESLLQDTYVGLLEEVLLHLQLSSRGSTAALHSQKLRKEMQEATYSLLDELVNLMTPATFVKSIASLLKHPDTRIRRKALRLFTAKMVRQDQTDDTGKKRKSKALRQKLQKDEVFDFGDNDMHDTMLTEIMGVLAESESSLSTKHAAILALDIYAQRYHGSSFQVFVSCIPALVASIKTSGKSLGAAAVRCTASIFRLLGPEALPALPDAVGEILKTAELLRGKASDVGESDDDGVPKMCLAILAALEALVEKLGLFLSPYLYDILGVVVLQQDFVNSASVEVNSKCAELRKLLPDKIPARLLLDPLVTSFDKAVAAGEVSTSALFQMIAHLASSLDRSAVTTYHGKIFNICLLALDLRRKVPPSFSSVSKVEAEVVGALVALVMKLGESVFRPLFIKALEWAQSTSIDGTDVTGFDVHRSISFYRLVNELASKLRSLFVPYFRYFLDGCVYQLTSGKTGEEAKIANPRKKRKQVPHELVSPEEWHVRVLVVSALDKCFMYDTVSFLDALKFQLLLGPLVLQLGAATPASAEEPSDVPSEKDMAESIVSCLGHMALAAGTDLLWQQLNHEVLMQTRSDSVRTRLLSLQVVSFLIERLREEYLVLLPETIAFLAELLEDSEKTVVAKTQDLVRTLEELSGEDLKQYL